ncbi:DUF2155 domain-containing protein [Rhizosaccharibacter radicis]|uniref:DUF2155 domain-containing protein n=1 Tax=Rhizosaccharibacter radicis TaxID=2782605 RepID=A0ABT1W142_9PROT|nr:DUF2155 domain-containing protein [Acetobacteraceae bacterium KSS12]
MKSRSLRSAPVLAAMLLAAGNVAASAAQYVPPPAMPVPNAWQGRSQGSIRVLDKLDTHVETLTLHPGEKATYKNLSVTLLACLDHPAGLPADSAAFLEIQDKRINAPPFRSWVFAAEPSLGVFESPVYGVGLIRCDGDLTAPAAPPLPAPPPPPAAFAPSAPDSTAPVSPGSPPDAPQGASSGTSVDGQSGPPPSTDGEGGDATGADPGSHTQVDGDAPDPVYPSGPPAAPPRDRR